MQRARLYVQLEADQLTAVFAPAGTEEIETCSGQGGPYQLADVLKIFVAPYMKYRPCVIGLLPRRSVLLTTLEFPTRNRAEARAMALLQFLRSTPHSREDMIVDAVPASCEGTVHTTYNCVMVTRSTLAPLMTVLSRAGLVAQRVSVSDLVRDRSGRCPFLELERGEGLFDLRDEIEKNRDLRHELLRGVKLIAFLFIAAAIIFILADGVLLWGRNRELARMNKELSAISAEVKDFLERREAVNKMRDSIGRRVVFSALARALSNSIPGDVRLSQLVFASDQLICLRGVGATIEDVSAFRDALKAQGICVDVEIKGMDKRPTESTEAVLFVLSCPWKGA